MRSFAPRTPPTRKRGVPRAVVLLAVVIGAALVAQIARAQEIERRTIHVAVIHATNDTPSTVDPEVEPVRKRLESRFHFSSYRMIQHVTLTLRVNQLGRVLLPNDTRLEIVPTLFDGASLQMKLSIIRMLGERQLVEISARREPESYLIIGGQSHEGGTLILVVSPGK